MIVRHTASFKLNRALERELRDHTGDAIEGGCLPYDPDKSRKIDAEMNGGQVVGVSVMRIVWALAHPGQHLTKTDEALHACGNTGDPGTACCCVNPEHIMKGDKKVRGAVAAYTSKERRASRRPALKEAA